MLLKIMQIIYVFPKSNTCVVPIQNVIKAYAVGMCFPKGSTGVRVVGMFTRHSFCFIQLLVILQGRVFTIDHLQKIKLFKDFARFAPGHTSVQSMQEHFSHREVTAQQYAMKLSHKIQHSNRLKTGIVNISMTMGLLSL